MGTDLDDALWGAVTSAEAEWGSFWVERAVFADRLRALATKSDDPSAALAKVHVADLYLAHGCLLGVAGAVKAFASKYLERIDHYLQRFHGMKTLRDDVRRLLEDHLLIARGDGPPRIGMYEGRGPLESFVARTACRIALSLLRRMRAEPSSDIDSLATPPSAPPEATRSLVRARYEVLIRDAVRASVAALDRRQRTILRLHLSKGVSFTQIARMLNVHQTTVSRRFETTLRQLHGDVRRRLRGKGLGDAEMDSIIRDVRSQIDLSLSRDFRDTGSVL